MFIFKEKMYEDNINLIGLTDELKLIYIVNKFKYQNKTQIVLTSSLYEATKFYENLKTHCQDVLFFPMDEFISSVVLATSPELTTKRLETLKLLKTNKKFIVVTNLTGFLHFLPSSNDNQSLTFVKNQNIDRLSLIKSLENMGYIRQNITTSSGEYSIRGYIIDIYPISMVLPVRIEFFGDTIESIRNFDTASQLSINNIEQVEVNSYKEVITIEKSSLLDYTGDTSIIYLNQDQIEYSYHKLVNDIFEYNTINNITEEHMFKLENLNIQKEVYLNDLSHNTKNQYKKFIFESFPMEKFNYNIDRLKQFVKQQILNKKIVIFYLSTQKQIKEMQQIFLNQTLITNEKDLKTNIINIIPEKINQGFIIDDFVVIGENDIDNTKNYVVNYSNSYHYGKRINSYDDIKKGDYIVHQFYGIGMYVGLKTIEKDGVKKDYIQLNYYDNDKVYIPVESISNIFKYTSKEGSAPKLSKLGTSTWLNTKKAVRTKIEDISGELLDLYASRKKLSNVPYKTFPEEGLFATDFIYEETIDQIKAIRDIDKDLASSKPMDRLLCGDVGYGKTEVAFRAMFKTILNNFQVAYLCPTTILSKQQYLSAVERFKNFSVNIALINRYTSIKELNQILKDLSDGKIDILFGTHRLLSEDVKFKNLNLLVVDEEQRFGVKHKEKIKNLKKNINVLTLSATPIPRTLKMAMSGLRDLSIIDTPPVNRYPVQTYVVEENDLLIKDAIYKELSRKGQIYILYNQVANIELETEKIKKLVPEARVIFAHGQMDKSKLDSVMEKFIDNEYDILVCTTIIESGIDISNVNTIIIKDADHFGLSQLYQIRGRVGRSNKIAYAYLLFNKNKILSEISVKRLQAIKEFTELGSGFKIAMRDLAIRGAGDLLGKEQAGYVSSVGIELFIEMLNNRMNELNGKPVKEAEKDTSIINVDTHISDDYVEDESVKIEIHKSIADINNLKDRFGIVSDQIKIYAYQKLCEKFLQKLEIKYFTQEKQKIIFVVEEKIVDKLEITKIYNQISYINKKIVIKYERKRLIVTIPILMNNSHFIYDLYAVLDIINKNIIL